MKDPTAVSRVSRETRDGSERAKADAETSEKVCLRRRTGRREKKENNLPRDEKGTEQSTDKKQASQRSEGSEEELLRTRWSVVDRAEEGPLFVQFLQSVVSFRIPKEGKIVLGLTDLKSFSANRFSHGEYEKAVATAIEARRGFLDSTFCLSRGRESASELQQRIVDVFRRIPVEIIDE